MKNLVNKYLQISEEAFKDVYSKLNDCSSVSDWLMLVRLYQCACMCLDVVIAFHDSNLFGACYWHRYLRLTENRKIYLDLIVKRKKLVESNDKTPVDLFGVEDLPF